MGKTQNNLTQSERKSTDSKEQQLTVSLFMSHNIVMSFMPPKNIKIEYEILFLPPASSAFLPFAILFLCLHEHVPVTICCFRLMRLP